METATPSKNILFRETLHRIKGDLVAALGAVAEAIEKDEQHPFYVQEVRFHLIKAGESIEKALEGSR